MYAHAHVELKHVIHFVPRVATMAATMAAKQSESSAASMTKEVLCVYRERRRPVRFICKESENETDKLLEAFKETFADVLEEGSSSESTSQGGFIIQRESKEWGGLIDVTKRDTIEHHARLHLQKMNVSKPWHTHV